MEALPAPGVKAFDYVSRPEKAAGSFAVSARLQLTPTLWTPMLVCPMKKSVQISAHASAALVHFVHLDEKI